MKKGRSVVSGLGLLVMALGLGAIACSGLLVWHNQQESDLAGDYARASVMAVREEISVNPLAGYLSNPEFIPDYRLNPGMDMPAVEIDGDTYVGQLEIPSLGLDLGVMEYWSYEGLRKAPGRYYGTPYTGTFVICAHNYKSHFGPIKDLEPGDRATFQDMDGNVFEYEVAEVREIDPKPDTQVTESGYDLVLTTCTLGGRTRWAVFFDLVG